MATYYADKANANRTIPVFTPDAGEVGVLDSVYDYATNLAAASIIEFGQLPPGAIVLGGQLYASDLDTGTEELDIDLGNADNGGSGTYDGADPDSLGNFGTITGDAFAAGNVSVVTGVNMPLAGLLATSGARVKFTEKTTIQAVVNTDAATLTAGSMRLVLYYTVD